MSRLGARGPLIAGALTVGLGMATVGARHLAFVRAEEAMVGAGLAWAQRHTGLAWARWEDVRGDGITIDRVQLQLVPWEGVRVSGVDVDVSLLRTTDPSAQPGVSAPTAYTPPVSVQGLGLRWGNAQLATDLAGDLRPTLAIEGPDTRIGLTDQGPSASVDRDVDLGWVSGALELTITCDTECTGRATMDAATLHHPMLAKQRLPPARLAANGTWSRDTGEVNAELSWGWLPATLSGELRLDPFEFQVDVDIEDWPLDRVMALFGAQIPEAQRADVRGSLGLHAEIRGLPLKLRLHPTAKDLAATGAISDIDRLRRGSFTWRAPFAEGEWAPRQTGEGHPSWVSLADAGLLPEAILAAEDSAFWTHPGYDLGAIQAALDDAAPGLPERGGSTLTQQLAKNLFLDGSDRTLARKLRELTLALELERSLGKERILALYLNVVEFGPGIHGARAAADTYFLKRPGRLTPREAAFLAAILPAPRTWYTQAYIGGRPPTARIDHVLNNMRDGKALSARNAAAAIQAPLRFVPPAR